MGDGGGVVGTPVVLLLVMAHDGDMTKTADVSPPPALAYVPAEARAPTVSHLKI